MSRSDKHPIASPDELPSCFGDRYAATDTRCRRCPARDECARHTAAWSRTPSLSEHIAQLAKSRHAGEAGAPETPEALYVRLCREATGQTPRLVTDRQRAVFTAVVKSCAEQGIDLATYIAGNIWALRRWLATHTRIGFQPTLLSGENALRRYHAYLGHLSRHFKRARHGANVGETPAATFRRQLFLGEFAFGEAFVAQFLAFGEATVASAIEEADPNEKWLGLETQRKSAYHAACVLFGAKGLKLERECARLNAAAAVAETYQHGLADRIGFTEFTWLGLARLIKRLVPTRTRERVELSDVEGAVWA